MKATTPTLPSEHKDDWQPFDYQNPPADGLYWVSGIRLVWDGHVDDYGEARGEVVGKTTYMALVEISEHPYGEGIKFETYAVAPDLFGDIDDCDTIEFYLPFTQPTPPKIKTN